MTAKQKFTKHLIDVAEFFNTHEGVQTNDYVMSELGFIAHLGTLTGRDTTTEAEMRENLRSLHTRVSHAARLAHVGAIEAVDVLEREFPFLKTPADPDRTAHFGE